MLKFRHREFLFSSARECGDGGGTGIPDDHTLLDELMASIGDSLAEETKAVYQRGVLFFRDFLLASGKTSLTEATKQDVISFFDNEYRKGLGNSAVSNRRSSLRRFYGYLLSEGIISLDPTIGVPVRPTKKGFTRNKALSKEELFALLREIDTNSPSGIRDYLMIFLAAGCGLRRSEIINLQVGDIDFKKKTIRVQPGKNGRGRLVTLYLPVEEVCIVYLEKARDHLLGDGKSKSLIIGPSQKEITKWFFGQRLEKYDVLDRHVTPHMFRHTYFSRMQEKGVPSSGVQKEGGHHSKSRTFIYSDIAFPSLEKAFLGNHFLPLEQDSRRKRA